MANTLALPTFVTGPTDKLAAVDVYKNQQQTGQVVNSIRNILQQYNPTLARSLAGFNSLDIQSIARAALNLGGSSTSAVGQQLLSRAMVINPNIAGSIRSMDASIREQFTNTMGNVGLKTTNQFGKPISPYQTNDPRNFMCTVDNVQRPIDYNNINKMQSIGDLVNSITGQPSIGFNDVGSQVGLHSSVIRECLDSNVSGVTKDIFSVIGDRQIMSIVAREVLPDVVKYSSVNDMYNLAGSLYEGELISAIPSLLNIFSRNFAKNQKSFYYNLGSQKHIATYAEILQAYDRTYPGWNTYVRNVEGGEPENAINISPLIEGTATFNSVLKSGATNSSNINEKPYLLAPLVSGSNVEQLLANQYRQTKFYFDIKVNKVVDPRTLNKI